MPGPAILIDEISTVVVEPQCTAFVTAGFDIRIEVGESEDEQDTLSTTKCDPIQLAIFSHRWGFFPSSAHVEILKYASR